MLDALDAGQPDRLGAEPHIPEALGVPAVYITCGTAHTEAPWCEPMPRTTGVRVSEGVRRTAALLLLAVGGTVYAIGCDQGYRLIPDHLKDKRFGLSFAIRQTDPKMIPLGALTVFPRAYRDRVSGRSSRYPPRLRTMREGSRMPGIRAGAPPGTGEMSVRACPDRGGALSTTRS